MKIGKRKTPIFLVAAILFGLKSYIVYRFFFQIDLGNSLQEIILFINPFITSIVFFGIAVWFKTNKSRNIFIRYSALIGTAIIYFNLLFYRSFTDFLTIPQMTQMSNMADLGTSIMTLIKFYDVILIFDVIIIWIICRKYNSIEEAIFTRKNKVFALVLSFILLSANFLLAEVERPQLLSRAFDREYLVKNIGVFYYHIYDVVLQSKMQTEKVFADDSDLLTIKHYINDEIRSTEQSELFGDMKGRNIIFISAESLQSFVINNTLDGEEITPFLNTLVHDSDTFYFENFYHQTAQGKTSDSEFITENSLYPISSGAVFFTHAQNNYNAMPKILKANGYDSYVFHANTNTFWNRNQMYENLEIDYFFDKDSFSVENENEIGWGLKDKEFFTQSIPMMQKLNQPFYAKMITITNHFPFELEEKDQTLAPYDSTSTTLNQYFPTVRYTDEAIEQFFAQLKLAGLYENSVIVIMGDHDGISANHNKAMADYLKLDDITAYDYLQLQRVPFFIHIPGYGEGKIMSTVAGQIDIKPTLLHVLGIETNHDIYFGNDLFHNDRKGFIAQRNGNFVSEDYLYAGETCYDRKSGDILAVENENANEPTPCTEIKDRIETELIYSDQIIYGDLFRFVDFKAK